MKIIEARTPAEIEQIRLLFNEYWAAFGFSACFQNFDEEVAGLPGSYASPRGRLALATVDGTSVGCIALRPISDDACEMKRLYVRDAFRGRSVGKELVNWIVAQARRIGYKRMYADTMPVMDKALAMYESMGFKRCHPYSAHATPGAIYLLLDL